MLGTQPHSIREQLGQLYEASIRLNIQLVAEMAAFEHGKRDKAVGLGLE